ncbi:hypothetical protein JKP88DRAFT_354038 [Tribonema minus]|uniref:Pentatricopeptide repeat-containing protein n=1 Tax=Tribonema minus TaxID=303371 RepID=A0A835Z2Y9_9STRA|nr:hypothetical protein JKP88DRAFT_354038 [Tribonema minus]
MHVTSINRGFASATPDKATDRPLGSSTSPESAAAREAQGQQSRSGSIAIGGSSGGGSGTSRSGAGSNGNSGNSSGVGVDSKGSNGASSSGRGDAGSNVVSTSGSSWDSTQSVDELEARAIDQLQPITCPATIAGQPSAPEQLPHAEPVTSTDWAHLVRTHVAARNPRSAVRVLSQMVDSGHKPARALFNAVLQVKPRYRSSAEGATVIALMSQAGVPAISTTYNLALRACRDSAAVHQADRILASMAAARVAPNRNTFVGVLRACRYAQDWRRAIDVFFAMEANLPAFADVYTWNRLLRVLSACSAPRSTLAAAALMAERGVAPIALTYMLILQAYAMLGDGAAIESVLSIMRAAGEEVTPKTLAVLANGYANSGRMVAAEGALEAALNCDCHVSARMEAVTFFMNACGRAGDLPRVVRWLRRLPSLGLAPTPRMWNVAVSAAYKRGDAAAADSLWREAGGAAYFGLCKVLVPPKEGASRGWTVLVEHPAEQPHATGVALDVSTCSVGMIHAALRAETLAATGGAT